MAFKTKETSESRHFLFSVSNIKTSALGSAGSRSWYLNETTDLNISFEKMLLFFFLPQLSVEVMLFAIILDEQSVQSIIKQENKKPAFL